MLQGFFFLIVMVLYLSSQNTACNSDLVQHIGSFQHAFRDGVRGTIRHFTNGQGRILNPGIPAWEANLFSILPMCDPDLSVACPWCMQSATNAFFADCMLQTHFNVPFHSQQSITKPRSRGPEQPF